MEKTQNIQNNAFFNIIKGIVISFVITMILLIILSAILTYTDTSESIISPSIIAITTISILIGSSIVNIKIKKNGIKNTVLLVTSMINVMMYLVRFAIPIF